ncbi:hypothetical protein GALL_507820 [mine drainage metagenome]|jgi:hypothetical protein|uniref:Uncharacterized protein n=1 Tax=mine drainage metagenome TaxID=410659 RepID=A0A1J5P8Q1_9ZZZZ
MDMKKSCKYTKNGMVAGFVFWEYAPALNGYFEDGINAVLRYFKIPLKQKKRKLALTLFVVTDLIIYHKELIG